MMSLPPRVPDRPLSQSDDFGSSGSYIIVFESSIITPTILSLSRKTSSRCNVSDGLKFERTEIVSRHKGSILSEKLQEPKEIQKTKEAAPRFLTIEEIWKAFRQNKLIQDLRDNMLLDRKFTGKESETKAKDARSGCYGDKK